MEKATKGDHRTPADPNPKPSTPSITFKSIIHRSDSCISSLIEIEECLCHLERELFGYHGGGKEHENDEDMPDGCVSRISATTSNEVTFLARIEEKANRLQERMIGNSNETPQRDNINTTDVAQAIFMQSRQNNMRLVTIDQTLTRLERSLIGPHLEKHNDDIYYDDEETPFLNLMQLILEEKEDLINTIRRRCSRLTESIE